MPVVDLVVRNIGQLVTCSAVGAGPLGLLRDAAVAAADGRVVYVGSAAALPELADDAVVIDADGALCTPGLCDPHAHPIFAGDRASEYAMRVEGRGYLEIQAAGGGIYSTVRQTRAASDEALLKGARARLERLLSFGVTTCEAKSGYALDAEGEIRLLRLLRRLAVEGPWRLSSTLLVHAVPEERRGERTAYLEEVANELIPRVAREGLAESCDVFCDRGAFTSEETRAVLTAARGQGLALRLHADQIAETGAAALAAELGARSADHLERISADGIAALAGAGTTAVLLPGAALCLGDPWPPARALIKAGVPVALGTDLNPGSSMTESLPLMMSLACTQMRMRVEEAWLAVTRVAADSLGRADAGRLQPGSRADLVLWGCDDYRHVPYHFGVNHVRTVVISGEVAFEA
ncbi:MAG: imidazolonepropionase [Deltaproteobacteria bacterium]|nr:imidazolonepropionase [Deltaproteobacteria bacterium]